MKKIHIVQLYINEMNTYGDRGNLLVLAKRISWHGYEPIIHYHHAGKDLPAKIDIVLGGGGQDSAQSYIEKDMQKISGPLHDLAEAAVPMLTICATYQLFGKRFITHTGEEMKGIGIFDAETIASEQRLIGNLAVTTDNLGILYGFENHSGRTHLGSKQKPLGTVMRGNGNNGQDKTEGARTNNVFGTYMHGPILPNNPVFADYLISTAAKNRYGEFTGKHIDNTLVSLARKSAKSRRYY